MQLSSHPGSVEIIRSGKQLYIMMEVEDQLHCTQWTPDGESSDGPRFKDIGQHI